MMFADSYDVIIIGTGAGGGTLARRLAPSGKRILILERGDFLPREKQNWDSTAVFQGMRYHTPEAWYDADGKEFRPHTGYFVGGNTKVYGGAMFRLRERDFETVQHEGGISPEWPVKYRDFEPYYREAEALYQVHGRRGIDPTEPPMSADYPFPPLAHEPRIQELHDRLEARGHRPFPIPLALKRNDRDPLDSPCIRCNTCDGFPCLVDGKADADVNGIRPAMRYPNVTLTVNARVTRLLAERAGLEIHGVPVVFQKTLAMNDYYWGDEDFPFPMGHIQLLGKTDGGILAADAPFFAPGFVLDRMARHSVDWWLTAEDLPHPDNRVVVDRKGAIHLRQRDRYHDHFDRLMARWKHELKAVDARGRILPFSLYLFRKIPMMGVAHQNGTCRFGTDPRSSVLNAFCQTHDVDNLYVVDGSFFCSSGAVNPSLTIAANALRVGDHLLDRLGR